MHFISCAPSSSYPALPIRASAATNGVFSSSWVSLPVTVDNTHSAIANPFVPE
ncbi:hypothetical protein PIB30_076073, partial [Stylosanthes scabra]|nr:hypothetical protein [Stylosanthes scabra]